MKIEWRNPAGVSKTPDFYLRNQRHDHVRDFYPVAPILDDIARHGTREKWRRPPQSLVDALAAANEEIGNPAGAALARRLSDPTSLVVTTGQQCHALGGPAMVAHKALSMVKIAEALKQKLGVPVIPLYWNHAEDHDLAEVAACALLRNQEVQVEDAPFSDLHRTAESVLIDENLAGFADRQIREIRWRGDPASLVPRVGMKWSDWSAQGVLATLHGIPLVIVEPRVIRPYSDSFWTAAQARGPEMTRAFADGTRAFESKFGPAPLQSPSGAFAFELLEDGRRVRLSETAFPTSSGPNRSPDAALRASYLQWFFPVVGHVFGPTELAYFGQISPMIRAMGLPVPAAIPRFTATWLRPREEKWRQELGLGGQAIFADPETWPEPPMGEDAAKLQTISERRQFAEAAAQAMVDGEPLERAFAQLQAKWQEAESKFFSAIRKEKERRGEAGRLARHRLAALVRPRGLPQERVLPFLNLAAGQPPGRLGEWTAQVDVFDYRHHLMVLEETDLAFPN